MFLPMTDITQVPFDDLVDYAKGFAKSTVPLMYTKNGNVPVDSLRYEHKWEDHPKYVALLEFWFDGEEIVKNNVHMMAKDGLVIGGQQAQM
jgi:hypothetical protein